MKQTLEEYADIAITDLEEKLGIFIVKQKPLVKERVVKLLQCVREATIKECREEMYEADYASWYHIGNFRHLDINTIDI